MKRLYATLLLIGIAGASVNAQEAKRLSLKDCMEYAVVHNYSIRNAKIDVLIQKAQNNQTLSAAYPHVSGKVEITDFLNPQKTFIEAKTFEPSAPAGLIVGFPFALNYSGTASVSASQLLFDGAVFIALKARNSVMELARQNEQVSEETVRYNVYKAYKSMVIAYRQYDILKRSIVFIRNGQRDLEIGRANGVVQKIDIDRNSVQLNNFISDSIRIGNMLTVSEQMLKYQMGMDINTPIVLADTAIDAGNSGVLALINEQQQYDRSPLFNALATTMKLNQYNLKRFQLSAWPSLGVFGAAGYNYATNKFVDIVTPRNYAFYSLIGLQLNVPIFSGMQRVNQVQEAKLNIEKSQNYIDNYKLTIDFQVASSRTGLKNAMLQVQNQKRNVDLAANVLDLAERMYKEGVGSNSDVTLAQSQLLLAQSNYFGAMMDQVSAEADLKKALGYMANSNNNN